MFVDTNVALFDHMALWTISNEACRINWCKYASSSSPGPAGTISASYRGSDFPIMAKMTTILDGWSFERWSYLKWTNGEVIHMLNLSSLRWHIWNEMENARMYGPMKKYLKRYSLQWRRKLLQMKRKLWTTVEDGVKYFTLTSNSNMFTAKVFIHLCFSKAAA